MGKYLLYQGEILGKVSHEDGREDLLIFLATNQSSLEKMLTIGPEEIIDFDGEEMTYENFTETYKLSATYSSTKAWTESKIARETQQEKVGTE